MIRVPFNKFEESVLPSRQWTLNGEGKWRTLEEEGKETKRRTNYEIYEEFPLKMDLPAYKEVDYESNFSCNN